MYISDENELGMRNILRAKFLYYYSATFLLCTTNFGYLVTRGSFFFSLLGFIETIKLYHLYGRERTHGQIFITLKIGFRTISYNIYGQMAAVLNLAIGSDGE